MRASAWIGQSRRWESSIVLMAPRVRHLMVVFKNSVKLAQMYSLNLFYYLPSPGWCSALLMSQAKAKLEFEKSVTTLVEVS